MKQKLLTLALLLCACLQTWADEWTDSNGVTWTYTLNGSNADITGSSKTSGSLDIPNKVNGYTVAGIGGYAFQRCSDLTSVTIPEGVTGMGGWVFEGCSGLTSVTFPSSMTNIGDNVFWNCSSLTKVITPDLAAWCSISFRNQYANPLYYAKHLYSDDNTEITDLVIPEGVTSIGNYSFINCSSLTSVTIPEGVTSIGKDAFQDCSGLTSVNIPSSVTSIGVYAFDKCSGLTNVTISSNVILSKDYTADSNIQHIFGSQVKEYIIGDGVTSIGTYAFNGCTNLTSVTIRSSVTNIGRYAFCNCIGLTSVTIPEGVTSISDYTFYNCSGLTSVTIPEGVTSIGNYAFQNCSGLTSVTIPEGVTSIGNYAFQNCSGLTSVTIPEGVTSIGERTFYNCSGLTSVTVPSSVTSIGESAFEGCSNITDLKLNCETIEDWFADSKTSLKTLTIGEGTTTISDSAFEGFSVLTTVSLGSNVSNIGANAFANLSKLEDVYCYAIRYPRVDASTFQGSYVEYVTLHVPEVSLQHYKNHAVWGLFFEIVPIDEPSAITDIEGDGNGLEIEAIYDLNGQRQPALRPGINIIKMNDGTIKKFLVK